MVFLAPQTFIFSVLYFFLLLLLISISDFFVYWIVIELRTLVFMGISYTSFKNNFRRLLIFFIVQTVSAFRLLVFYLTGSTLGFTLSLLIKLAIFPYYFWYFALVSSFPNFILYFSMTLFKIPSILILSAFFSLVNFSVLFFSSLSTIAIGGLVIVFSNDLRFIIIGSSVANNSWFVLTQLYGTLLFFIFFVLYSLFLYLVFSSFGVLVSSSSKNTQISGNSNLILRLVVLSGLPPFPIFYVKMFVVLYIVDSLNMSLFVMLAMLLNVLVLLGYMKYIFSYFMFFYSNSKLVV